MFHGVAYSSDISLLNDFIMSVTLIVFGIYNQIPSRVRRINPTLQQRRTVAPILCFFIVVVEPNVLFLEGNV